MTQPAGGAYGMTQPAGGKRRLAQSNLPRVKKNRSSEVGFSEVRQLIEKVSRNPREEHMVHATRGRIYAGGWRIFNLPRVKKNRSSEVGFSEVRQLIEKVSRNPREGHIASRNPREEHMA